MLNFLELPFDPQSFSGKMSPETFDFHYNKHHKTYFDNLVKLIAGTDLENDELIDIVKKSDQQNLTAIFNNSAQVFNHNFYWQSLSPEKKEISEYLLSQINKNFLSLENFKEELKKTALGKFGSGWAWVVLEEGNIKIIATSNAETPITKEQIPLLVIDVWEHAYYIDYRNRRAEYLDVLISDLLNWEFFENNLKANN